MNIFGFSKVERKVITVILLSLFLVVGFNLRISLRKSRDNQRKSDVRSIHDGLMAYQADFGTFPLSFEGDILACLTDEKVEFYKNNPAEEIEFTACKYGWEPLGDELDASYANYLERIPTDPHHKDGVRYYYISNGSRFQIYAALESDDEPEYDEKILARGITCGNEICNFGRSLSNTPLDKSIEEYENELNAKQ